MRGESFPISVEGAKELFHAPGPMIGYLALGAPILGAGLGAIAGGCAYAIARVRAQRKSRVPNERELAMRRTLERYRAGGGPRSTPYYVKGKLAGDPVTAALDLRRPLGDVLDLGCGHGQLALFLLESGAAASVVGCDWDARKIVGAKRAASGAKARFVQGDLRRGEDALEPADTVLLVDVLHYLEREAQDALLLRAARLVRAGGRLFVRDASLGFGARSLATSLVERCSRLVRWHRGDETVMRDVARELVPPLEALGMSCEVVPCWKGTPFSNVLLVARR